MRTHNFSAGPAILPEEVLQEASRAVLEFNNLGMSLLEISHRSKDFIAVVDEAKALAKELLEIPEGYSVIFLQGGASTQFSMVPFNLLKDGGYAAYVNTGVWSAKAIKEADRIGKTQTIASSADKKFNYIPKNISIPKDADYVHITSNNTIYGTQFHEFPNSPVPMVCDMSSDIFSRPVDVSKFALIYAGAQKNMGPAGATMVIIRNDLLGKSGRNLPVMLDYKEQVEGDSLYNTPPVFAIYVSMLTMRWLKKNGGLSQIEKENKRKGDLFYNELDRNPALFGTAEKADRSLMNATFLLKDEANDAEFSRMLKEANISGLKGHRSAGGYRASMYNALPYSSVEALVDVMQEFGKKFGN